jgi:hypothetical protein
MEGRVKRDTALVPLVQRERCSSSTSCAGLQSRELPAHARDSRADCGVVADESAGEADQDWYNGRQPRSLRHVPDRGGRNHTAVVRCDHAENCCFAIVPNGYGNMSTSATVRARKATGELRPYEYAAGFWGGQSPRSWSVSCRANRAGRRGARKPPESSGGDANRSVIWGIPARLN